MYHEPDNTLQDLALRDVDVSSGSRAGGQSTAALAEHLATSINLFERGEAEAMPGGIMRDLLRSSFEKLLLLAALQMARGPAEEGECTHLLALAGKARLQ